MNKIRKQSTGEFGVFCLLIEKSFTDSQLTRQETKISFSIQ